ncbi:uncharacterized protein BHQ10_009861 [Talaromyces amestolkiae]|uniref:Major facilitator superfamily (MFS) profile domain-containing protein n=1 Tax=Talaromyces amestolkiae TaxID=1196081 RepID=A0A364LDK5_TALAM|nr:uncharacterized protein BHQ10_009861 [Talaromyces amestolkiae]RAO73849.1 hypothetical protein BHQ10_009861 [Talaromyces amestolkiae]
MTQDSKTSQPIQGTNEEVEQIETLSPQVNDNINEKSKIKEETTAAPEYVNEFNEQVSLSWRSWMVVLVSCFAIVAQVFVVTAAGSVIAFIIRDLGKNSPDAGALAGWIIQGPLLMQSVLSPIVGRLSDVLDRKYIASVPPLIAFVGAVVSAKATSISMLIGGGILIGATLATIAIVQAIPSEILPLKHRALANGFAYMGGAIGGISGGLVAGAVTEANPSGWRDIFWIQAGLHIATSAGLLLFYHPTRRTDYPRMSFKEHLWACDPIGSLMFIASVTCLLLSLNWAAGLYAWSDVHVAAPLGVGLFLFVLFCLYEWKGRNDGLVAHVFFQGSPNFALSVFAFAVEGWIFYSAVTSVIPQVTLYLGLETSALIISVRGLAYNASAALCSMAITWYSTRTKDLKWPLVVTFGFFLIATITYTVITPSMNKAQIGFNVLIGIGLSGPLTLLVALVQFTAPHRHLSTATGLAFSARAIGGAFGSAVLDAIINGVLGNTYASKVSTAAVDAGLPQSDISALLAAMSAGTPLTSVPGINTTIAAAAEIASQNAYAHAYHLAWASIIPFVVLGIGSVLGLKGVKHLMTEEIEATVEHVPVNDVEKPL